MSRRAAIQGDELNHSIRFSQPQKFSGHVARHMTTESHLAHRFRMLISRMAMLNFILSNNDVLRGLSLTQTYLMAVVAATELQ